MSADLRAVQVEYVPDATVDAELDQQLRALLSLCFTKPHDAVFQHRRYFLEPYPHRWMVREAAGRVIAHVGAHDKSVEADGERFRIGGICEVCVHPAVRGRGLVRRMLAVVHGSARTFSHFQLSGLLFVRCFSALA